MTCPNLLRAAFCCGLLRIQVNAGDSDRVSELREELNSLVVAEGDTAPATVS